MSPRLLAKFAMVALVAAATLQTASVPALAAPSGTGPAATGAAPGDRAAVVGGGGWAHAGSPPGATPSAGGAARASGPAATPPGYTVAGIDVSSNDHSGGQTIDWAGQAAAGVRFAYVKATEGSDYLNPYFASDYQAAKNQGLYVGAYDYARPDSDDPVEQADYFLANAQWANDGQTLVPLLDIEWPYAAIGLPDCWGLTPTQISSWIASWVNEVQAKIGRAPMIYTSTGWWNPCTGNDASSANLPLDIAGYSASPPTLPAGWNQFALWQYADSPWPGDKDVFNGTLAGLAALAGVGQVTPHPAFESVLARTPQSSLVVYPNAHGRGASTLSPSTTVGLGWGGMNPIDTSDVNGDGRDDIVTRDGSGNLWEYPDAGGTGTSTFGAKIKLGVGWGGMNLIETGDVNGDGRDDIVTRDGSGNLWEYANAGGTGTSTYHPGVKLGVGWGGMNTVKLADLNGDGKVDLIARDSSGNLWMYPGTGGTGTSTFASHVQLGVGWGGMNAIALGDMNGDGRPDLMARDSAGVLWLYPNAGGNGVHTLAGRSELGTGWGGMTTLDLGTF
ncbi:GH25 family lysozyme [Rugosimonospora acidiphila]